MLTWRQIGCEAMTRAECVCVPIPECVHTRVSVCVGVGGVLTKTFQDGPLADAGPSPPDTRIPLC